MKTGVLGASVIRAGVIGAGVIGACAGVSVGAGGGPPTGYAPAGLFQLRARSGEPGQGVSVRQPIVASLSYDGTSTWGFRGQDYESVFDAYDTFVCEPFGLAGDAVLTSFLSIGFGTANPFGATDVIVQIYGADQRGEICDDGTLPTPLMTSIPGVGFNQWNGHDVESITDFGGQCLPEGNYIMRFGVRMDFTTFGSYNFFGQSGEHDNGLGEADDGFQSNPGNAFNMGFCFDVVDGGIGLPTGINFVLCGEAGDCDPPCPDPDACGDWDSDGDSDADDFFAYLTAFSLSEPCADLDGDADFDSDDFFAYLTRFTSPC